MQLPFYIRNGSGRFMKRNGWSWGSSTVCVQFPSRCVERQVTSCQEYLYVVTVPRTCGQCSPALHCDSTTVRQWSSPLRYVLVTIQLWWNSLRLLVLLIRMSCTGLEVSRYTDRSWMPHVSCVYMWLQLRYCNIWQADGVTWCGGWRDWLLGVGLMDV